MSELICDETELHAVVVCNRRSYIVPRDVADELARLARSEAALHERLEDNFAWDSNGNRVEHEPGSIPDGIACRDETIRGQDEVIARLRAESAEHKADAERYRWLRNHPSAEVVLPTDEGSYGFGDTDLDEVIDAARGGEGP